MFYCKMGLQLSSFRAVCFSTSCYSLKANQFPVIPFCLCITCLLYLLFFYFLFRPICVPASCYMQQLVLLLLSHLQFCLSTTYKYIYIYIYTHTHRMSQEEWTKLRGRQYMSVLGIHVMYSAWSPKDIYDMSASVFVVQFNGFMSLIS